MREPTVWERKGRGFWTTIDGKQTFLADDRKEAERQLHRHLAGMGLVKAEDLLLTDLIDLFLDACTNGRKSKQNYGMYLGLFAKTCGRVKVSEVRKLHVTRWLKEQHWSPATQNTAIGVAKQVFN
jgi:hypothetical protein